MLGDGRLAERVWSTDVRAEATEDAGVWRCEDGRS